MTKDKTSKRTGAAARWLLLTLLTLIDFVQGARATDRTLDGNATSGYSINMPATGTDNLILDGTVTTFKVYSDGGPSRYYSNNSSGTLVLTAPDGYVLQVSGTVTTEIGNKDYLQVHDGSTTSATQLGKLTSSSRGATTAIPNCTSSGNSMTLYFKSDGYVNYIGLNLTVMLIDPSMTYDITVNSATGGSVVASVDNTSATKSTAGKTVTLTATPSEGYVLQGITVNDGNNDISITGGTFVNNTATFTMPNAAVTVTPTFTTAKTADEGLYLNMPATGTVSGTIPEGVTSFKVYDDGGSTGNYSDNYAGVLVLTAPDGYILQVNGTVTTERSSDYLQVHDGGSTGATQLGKFASSSGGTETSIPTCLSSGNQMTLYFHSNYITNYAGLNLTVTLFNTAPYDINIDDVTGGSVMASVDNSSVTSAIAGQTVTLTATPSEGYVLQGITVNDGNNDIIVTGGTFTNNTATFKMPLAAVTVPPIFTNTLTTEGGLYINMPTTGTVNGTIPTDVTSFKVYDAGGKDGNYSNQCTGTLVLTAPDGYVLQVSGTVTTEGVYDELQVHDGKSTSASQLGKFYSNLEGQSTAITTCVSSGNQMTLYFESDGSSNYAGLDLTVTVLPTYSVTLNTNDGTINSGNVTSYTYGIGATLPTDVTKTGYTFGGWYTTSELTGDAMTEIAADAFGDKTFWAKWTATNYTVTYNIDGGSVATDNPTTYTIETADFTLNNPTRKGYTFTGWTGSNGETPQTSVTIAQGSTGDKTYTANWAFDLSDGGTEAEPYEIASVADWNLFAASVKSGTTFTGKYVKLGADLENISTIVGDNDHAFSGTFNGDGHTLKVDINVTNSSTFAAPFAVLNDGTIKNLTVTGNVTSNSGRVGGLVGVQNSGTSVIDHCTVDVDVTSSISGDNTIGGVMAFATNGITELTISNTLYTGSVRLTGEPHYTGAFVAAVNKTVSFINCLSNGTTAKGSRISGTLWGYQGGGTYTAINCYYKEGIDASRMEGTAVSAEQLASGEVCYLLNGSTSDGTLAWYQTIDEDTTPVLDKTHKTVRYAGGTVGYLNDALTIDDNAAFSVENEVSGVNVTFNRTFTAGNWSTIILPFALTATQMDAAFSGYTYKVVELTGVTDGNLSFTSVTAMEADKPYLIKFTETPASPLVFNDVTLTATPSVADAAVSNGTESAALVGSYAETSVPQGAYILQQNKIWLVTTDDVKIKPFRAYLTYSEPAMAPARSLSFFVDGDAWYTIGGQRLSAKPTVGGVYIHNGKKVVIK